jgi:hypothetical protein
MWGDQGVLLHNIHHPTPEGLYNSAQLGCRICSILKERWEALGRSLANLPLRPRTNRGLVSCFLYKRPILRPDRQSEELHVNLYLQLMDMGLEIPEEERSVNFILVSPGGSYS